MTERAIFCCQFGLGGKNFCLFLCCKGREKVTLYGSNAHVLCFIERTQNNKYNKLLKKDDSIFSHEKFKGIPKITTVKHKNNCSIFNAKFSEAFHKYKKHKNNRPIFSHGKNFSKQSKNPTNVKIIVPFLSPEKLRKISELKGLFPRERYASKSPQERTQWQAKKAPGLAQHQKITTKIK